MFGIWNDALKFDALVCPCLVFIAACANYEILRLSECPERQSPDLPKTRCLIKAILKVLIN